MIYIDFKEECQKALVAKKLNKKSGYQKRLDHELEVLQAQDEDYTDSVFQYFWDMKVETAKTGKIENSNNFLISYLLDISDSDPVPDGRELIKTKAAEFPDIDMDFEDTKRELVKEYLIEKYGQENVASISSFHLMHGKSVVKDVARIKDIPYDEVDLVTKGMSDEEDIETQYWDNPELKAFFDRYVHLDMLELCKKFEGNIRHMSMHPAGVVISPQGTPLSTICGLEKTKDAIVTCWDGKTLGKVGLIKFDILGLNTLRVINFCVKAIKENHGVDLDIDEVEINDKITLDGFYNAKTVGVFQFEKGWIRGILKQIKIDAFGDIAASTALLRPGPMDAGMDKKFWKVKNGFEKPSYLHPMLEPILKDTYCVILYQEQVMEIASQLAGFKPDEADTFRSVLSKGKADLSKGINPFEKYEKKFISGCRKNGIKEFISVEKDLRSDSEIPTTAKNVEVLEEGLDKSGIWYKKIKCDVEISDELFSQIKTFARYGFNKAHSVEYGFIAYQCMYLKTHYPKEYLSSLLSNTPNKYDPKNKENKFVDYFVESKKLKVKVNPPDINTSVNDFKVIDGEILAGFGFIKSLGKGAISDILSKRPFNSFYEFLTKIDGRKTNKSSVLALIHTGCFDKILGIDKREDLVRRYELVSEYLTFRKDKKREAMPSHPSSITACEAETEYTGGEIFNSVLHMIDLKKINETFQVDDQIMKFSALQTINESTTIRIAAIVISYSSFTSKNGNLVGILNLKNGSNLIKAMAWKKEVMIIDRRPDIKSVLMPGNVVTVRVKRGKDFKGQKSFILDLERVEKLI